MNTQPASANQRDAVTEGLLMALPMLLTVSLKTTPFPDSVSTCEIPDFKGQRPEYPYLAGLDLVEEGLGWMESKKSLPIGEA
jgi:hypothetical protein